jgi:hypothetical protein
MEDFSESVGKLKGARELLAQGGHGFLLLQALYINKTISLPYLLQICQSSAIQNKVTQRTGPER